MFGPSTVHLSPITGTKRTLGFLRHGPATLRDSGEEIPHFIWVASCECDVQPIDGGKIFNTKLAQTYGQMYTIVIPGDVDIRRQDRTTIDGAECVVEQAYQWGGHTELTCGSTEPGDY